MSDDTRRRVAAAWLPLPDVNTLEDASLARWLFRGEIARREPPIEPLIAFAIRLRSERS